MPLHHHAFISYSHAADARLAPAFEDGLERIGKPLLKLRGLDVFRDGSDLSASPGLWSGILSHLQAAEWLLFFASPQSTASPWCGQELEWWLANRGTDRLLIVLTGGEILWDKATRDFDWNRTTALPRCIAGHLTDEPLYADLSWATGAESLSLDNTRFHEAVTSVAAPLRGMRRDELDNANVRQLRRNRLFVQSGVTAIAIAAVLAIWQAKLARDAEAVAVEQRQRAESALADTRRELLHARSAELRALSLRLDQLATAARARPDGAFDLAGIEQEQRGLALRLADITRQHQAALAARIGFRGDLDFLMKWEGVAGSVKLIGRSGWIDPATDLAQAKPEVIRTRYEFLLTPAELQAVLVLAGKRDDAAKAAFAANPILERIRIKPADVAQLVPEAVEPWWKGVLSHHPVAGEAGTPGAVQTALLSLAFNVGFSHRFWDPLAPLIAERRWAELADAIEALRMPASFPALKRRRAEEAALIRAALPKPPG